MVPTIDETYTLTEAAEILGLQRSYVYKLVSTGVFTTTRDERDKRVRRITATQLISFKPDVRFKLQPQAPGTINNSGDIDVSEIIEGYSKPLDVALGTINGLNELVSKMTSVRSKKNTPYVQRTLK